MAQWSRIFGAVAGQVAGIRRFGSAALDLAHVAAGRYEGFWESDLQPWDVAAGMLLVREAGGFVTDFRGGDQCIARREFLAGNDTIHSKLHKLVRSEEHTSELQSLMRISYAVFCLKKKNNKTNMNTKLIKRKE